MIKTNRTSGKGSSNLLTAIAAAPIRGAAVFVAYATFEGWIINKPGSQYVPILSELFFFVAGYVFCCLANAVVGIPLLVLFRRLQLFRTSKYRILKFSLIESFVVCIICVWPGFLPSRLTVFSPFVWLYLGVPLLVTAHVWFSLLFQSDDPPATV
jgi:hypothetical protein